MWNHDDTYVYTCKNKGAYKLDENHRKCFVFYTWFEEIPTLGFLISIKKYIIQALYKVGYYKYTKCLIKTHHNVIKLY